MRRRKIIILITALVLTGAAIICVCLAPSAGKPQMSLDYSSLRSGRFGKIYSPRFTVATLTNAMPVAIFLRMPRVEKQRTNGIVVTELFNLWNGKDDHISVEAGESASVPVGVDLKDVVKFRVTFDYELEAGALRGRLSHFIGKVGRNTLPKSLYGWLLRNGWIDGFYRRTYVGAWTSEESLPSAPESQAANEDNR